MNGILNTENTSYKYIEETCRKHGISISELCRRADVRRQLMNDWRGGDPKSVAVLKKLNVELEKLEHLQEQPQESHDVICRKTSEKCEFKCENKRCKLID